MIIQHVTDQRGTMLQSSIDGCCQSSGYDFNNTTFTVQTTIRICFSKITIDLKCITLMCDDVASSLVSFVSQTFHHFFIRKFWNQNQIGILFHQKTLNGTPFLYTNMCIILKNLIDGSVFKLESSL